MSRESFPIKLKWTKTIAPQVRHLVFQCESAEPFTFIPGQFITLLISFEGKLLRRSYSIANTHLSEPNTIEFAASYVEGGIASQLLFNIQPGEEITTTGPFGRLILREEQVSRYILVATGTGVTPYRAMLHKLAQRFVAQPNLKVVLLFGVRQPEDLLYREDFVTFAEQHPQFEFRAYYSRARCHERYEHQGYVQNAFANLHPDPQNDIVYLCGNPNMIDECYGLLSKQGFATLNVRREKYISSN